MNVGLPGTGIGGVFYLLSALLMPLREAWRIMRGDRDGARLRRVLIQWTLAAGVVTAIWLTGIGLGWMLRFGAAHAAGRGEAGAAAVRDVPEVLRTAALLITFGTLAGVLSVVHVMRFIVRLRDRSRLGPATEPEGADGVRPAASGRASRRVVRAATIALALFVSAAEVAAQTSATVTTELARADSAFAGDDYAQAREGYAAVLRQDPQNSRATYQLARLAPAGSAEALRLYRQYVTLEPDDAWGWIALGEAALSGGRNREAIRSFAEAARLAPDEPDAVIAHARARALATAAAPALEPNTGASHDSDGNTSIRFGMAGDLLVMDGLRLGAGVERKRVSDDFVSADHDQAGAYARWQPRRGVRVDAGVSAVRTGIAADTRTFGATSVRARWLAPDHGPILELRGARSALAASPTLLANDVRIEQLRGTLELPVRGPLRVRGLAQAARIAAAGERNTRTAAGGALVVRATPLLEWSGGYHRIAYDEPTTLGYFAPRTVQLVEAGSYAEVYAGNIVLALDLGAGAQRVERHDDVPGDWTRALRLWSHLSWTLRPGLSLDLELEAYDSQIEAVGTGAGWRYGGAGVSIRWAAS